MVANVAFDAVYDGERVHIAAGEIVADSHDLVLAYPAHFSRPAAFGRTLRPRAIPLARRAAGTTPRRLELTRAARDALEELAAGYDGDETGGGLFGHRDGDVIVIDNIERSTWWATRTATSCEIESDFFRSFDRRYIASGRPTRFIGDVHLHNASARPSDVDLRGWKASVRAAIGYHVGLIVGLAHDENGWPWIGELNGWITTADGACVPASIT